MRFSVALLFLLGAGIQAQEPPLPAGLGPSPAAAEPALPVGLGGGGSGDPPLPPGLEGEPEGTGAQAGTDPEGGFRLPRGYAGFLEGRAGTRLGNDPGYDDTTLLEARLRTEYERRFSGLGGRLSFDLLGGESVDETVDLRRGEGWLDLREAWVLARPGDQLDLKAGRMISTWGTGDLVFINDLFPKDWRSFLLGRDEDYLKAPNDGVRATWFSSLANVDVVYGPRFNPDRFVDGRDLSFGAQPTPGAVLDADIPSGDEVAARLFRAIGPAEAALYFYDGYWKSPGGFSPSGQAVFPDLRVYGASVRGPALGGIGWLETGYYDSPEDAGGRDPLVNNSEWRFLAGHDRELAPKLNAGFQWYVEWMQDHDAYARNLPPGFEPREEWRHVLTLRVTRLLLRDDLTLSFFGFYSPSDEDFYLRPAFAWKLGDAWRLSGGLNLFGGESEATFFGQFEDNTNAYVALRRSW